MSLEKFLLLIILPFLLFITGLIAYYIFSNRRRKNVQLSSFPLKEEIIVDCSIDLKNEFALKKRIIKLAFSVVPLFVYFTVMSIVLVGEGPEALTILSDQNSPLFKVALILPFLMAAGSLMGYYSRKSSIDNFNKAIKLSQDKKLILKLNSDGITIPTLLLTDPAFWRATEKGLTEIVIPLNEIKTVEVWNGSGNSPDQFNIKTDGQSAEWGHSALGSIMLGIGVKRKPLRNSENEILTFLKSKLGERLHFHIDIDNAKKLDL